MTLHLKILLACHFGTGEQFQIVSVKSSGNPTFSIDRIILFETSI